MPAFRSVLVLSLLLAFLGRPAASASASPTAIPGDAAGLITILDGAATVLRGVHRFSLAEGVRLAAGDIVVTGSDHVFLRAEFQDKGFVELGPESQAMIEPHLKAPGRLAPRTYLLQGWAKTDHDLGSPAGDVSVQGGVVVLDVQDARLRCFFESGHGELRAAGATPLVLKGGEYIEQQGGRRSARLPEPAQAFRAAMPPAFADTLPARAPVFAQKVVVAKPAGDPAYPDLQRWIDAEPALRLANLPRWLPLAQRPDIREALIAGLSRHPEWKPVLFPPPAPPINADPLRRP